MHGTRRRLTLVVLPLCLPALALACEPATLPAPAGHERPLLAAPRDGFEPVANALVATCGTLDCHGQPGRNLRLFGIHGLRLAKEDDPGGRPTSAAEYEASYWSIVGLEPEDMDTVVRARGGDPERLSLVRKARGTERHKGGALTRVGDPLDRCLRAWLASRPDAEACEAAEPVRPGKTK